MSTDRSLVSLDHHQAPNRRRPGPIPFYSRLIITSVKLSEDWVGDSICRVSDVFAQAGVATDPADLDYDTWIETLKEDCDLKEIEEEQVIQYIPLSGPSHRVVVTCERSWVACLQETLLSDPDAVCFKFRFGNPEHFDDNEEDEDYEESK